MRKVSKRSVKIWVLFWRPGETPRVFFPPAPIQWLNPVGLTNCSLSTKPRYVPTTYILFFLKHLPRIADSKTHPSCFTIGPETKAMKLQVIWIATEVQILGSIVGADLGVNTPLVAADAQPMLQQVFDVGNLSFTVPWLGVQWAESNEHPTDIKIHA